MSHTLSIHHNDLSLQPITPTFDYKCFQIQIPAGLPHHIDFRAMAEIKGKPNKNFKVIEGDEMSQAPKGNRYIYYGGR